MWRNNQHQKQLRKPLSGFLRRTLYNNKPFSLPPNPSSSSATSSSSSIPSQFLLRWLLPASIVEEQQPRRIRHPVAYSDNRFSVNNSCRFFCSAPVAAEDEKEKEKEKKEKEKEKKEKESICCWNCKSPRPFLVCDSCASVQPVDHSVDYFQIFGLEKKFEIEDGNLEGKYKDWQKKLHPDMVHTKSEREREYAAEQSARVIDAYRKLCNPLSRAIYIMRLEGVEVDEEKTVSEADLLSEIMEIREAVEEAKDSQVLNHVHFQMQEKIKHWSNSFANAFRSKNFVEALTSIQRMTYYDRVKEEIIKKL